MTDRALIVNADDFGLSAGTNAGIIEAHERGIVTSASLMVHRPAAPAAASLARKYPELSVGLHADLGEWLYADGDWTPRYERGPAQDEIPRQLDRFRALMGCDPTHLDSHQHVHREGAPATVMAGLADELLVPLRGRGNIRYCGDFYGQTGTGERLPDAIIAEALIGVIERLEPGITEVACHPGLDPELRSSYRWERLREVETLCHPAVAAALDRRRVRLISYREISEPLS